ncbi:unnamed protein product [Symbiodinium natans]|uniref:Uncharacterized protein n=1 Tax=Symbiodinium natans TaxID=878477 RepID=A0A812HU86_9DINO|nr:unnamed protein product [Symbiodinium natans]
MCPLNKAGIALHPACDVEPVPAMRAKTDCSETSTALESDITDTEPVSRRSLRNCVDVIIAVEEGCSRMAFERHAAMSGLGEDDLIVCVSSADLVCAVEKAVVSNLTKPLAVIVGEASWLEQFPEVWRGRFPYVIDASCWDSDVGTADIVDKVLLASCSHAEFEDALRCCVDRCAYA